MGETQLLFWKPTIKRHQEELTIVLDYYNKTKDYFSNIEEESKEYGNKLFREYPGGEDTDTASVAEWAQEESVEMYLSLLTMKSNHLLMTISLLYHTWEQQLIRFTINELSHDLTFIKKALEFKEVQTIFRLHGINIPDTISWTKIRELKFLTNTIKHGNGESADKLRKIRPDFFRSDLSGDSFDTLELHGAVLLNGHTLRVTEKDLEAYVSAVTSFWDEMPERAYCDVDTLLREAEK
ncbi:hypothetical protein NYE54_05455 [Paenibacillus sp. FSL K6-1330]|uniref:hypothetical protein n=1 Tax=Paenibacillus sp. FSL K6-1330 TaxID=2975292 RepID=UPI0030DC3DA9